MNKQFKSRLKSIFYRHIGEPSLCWCWCCGKEEKKRERKRKEEKNKRRNKQAKTQKPNRQTLFDCLSSLKIASKTSTTLSWIMVIATEAHGNERELPKQDECNEKRLKKNGMEGREE
jgi:hypothetical protein